MELPDKSEFEEWLNALRELIPAEKRLSYAEHVQQVLEAEEAFFRTHTSEEEVQKIIQQATTQSSARSRRRPRKRPQE